MNYERCLAEQRQEDTTEDYYCWFSGLPCNFRDRILCRDYRIHIIPRMERVRDEIKNKRKI